MDEPERFEQDDLGGQEASVLPAREAMSLISPDSSMLTPSLDAVPTSPDPVEQTGAPGETSGQTTTGQLATDAQASGSGEESVSSEDRSEQISNRDTATSET